MPPKKKANSKSSKPNNTRHGTQEGQQTNVEEYKNPEQYKNMRIVNDSLSNRIKELYDNNSWNLKSLFRELQDNLDEMGNKGKISWQNKIQYLEFKNKNSYKKTYEPISLEAFANGDFKNKYIDKKDNKATTEKMYAGRISYFIDQCFPQYKNKKDLEWIITNQRELIYKLLKYHSEKNNAIPTINKDFKVLVRVIKLMLGEDHELRYKFSALQIAFTDLENMADDLNKVKSKQELRSFVPYEQLLDICDDLDRQYQEGLNKLSPENRENGKKHSNDLFNIHQLLLAFAMNVWDYPSRREKYTMSFLKNEKDALSNKNYIVIPDNNICKVILNEVVKEHKPISYTLNSPAILQLNKRLCELLKMSYKVYPRTHIFIAANGWQNQKLTPVAAPTVSIWLRKYISSKNIGIDTFRSSFVSYYFPKFNNRQRYVLKTRMRTSMDIMMRSYLKFYSSPDDLVNVKIEPSDELLNVVDQGTNNFNAIYANDDDQNEDIENDEDGENDNNQNQPHANHLPQLPNDPIEEVDIQEKRRDYFKKWYQREENKEKKKKKLRDPATYSARYINELNSGRQSYERLHPNTIAKYNIKVKDGIYYI
jgi:hypothetical protein